MLDGLSNIGLDFEFWMDFGLLDYVSNIIDCLEQHISSLMNFHRLDRVDELSTM